MCTYAGKLGLRLAKFGRRNQYWKNTLEIFVLKGIDTRLKGTYMRELHLQVFGGRSRATLKQTVYLHILRVLWLSQQ